MKNRSLRAFLVLFMLFTLASLAACGKTVKTIKTGKTGSAKVETSADGVKLKFKNDEGEVEINTDGAELPDNWPEDVPAFPKAKVVSAVKTEGGPEMKMAIFQTAKPVAEATRFYEKQLPDNGWEITNRVETGPTAVLLMAAKDKQTVTVTVTNDPESGDTIISVAVALKPE